MTAYVAVCSTASTTTAGVKVGTPQVKLARIEFYNQSSAGPVTISRYTGATFSGGTTVTPLPLREGAAAASATAKCGATISGTQIILETQQLAASGSMNYAPPFDFIMSTGSAVWVSCSFGFLAVLFYFEELNLARSV